MLGKDIGVALCKALGLPRQTSRVDISVPADGLVEVVCRYYPSVEAMNGLIELLQRYRLEADGAPEVAGVCEQADPGWRILPREQWALEVCDQVVLAGIFVNADNVLCWVKYPLSALPNHLIGLDDLERAGIAGQLA